jgi:hypothetical protein
MSRNSIGNNTKQIDKHELMGDLLSHCEEVEHCSLGTAEQLYSSSRGLEGPHCFTECVLWLGNTLEGLDKGSLER